MSLEIPEVSKKRLIISTQTHYRGANMQEIAEEIILNISFVALYIYIYIKPISFNFN